MPGVLRQSLPSLSLTRPFVRLQQMPPWLQQKAREQQQQRPQAQVQQSALYEVVAHSPPRTPSRAIPGPSRNAGGGLQRTPVGSPDDQPQPQRQRTEAHSPPTQAATDDEFGTVFSHSTVGPAPYQSQLRELATQISRSVQPSTAPDLTREQKMEQARRMLANFNKSRVPPVQAVPSHLAAPGSQRGELAQQISESVQPAPGPSAPTAAAAPQKGKGKGKLGGVAKGKAFLSAAELQRKEQVEKDEEVAVYLHEHGTMPASSSAPSGDSDEDEFGTVESGGEEPSPSPIKATRKSRHEGFLRSESSEDDTAHSEAMSMSSGAAGDLESDAERMQPTEAAETAALVQTMRVTRSQSASMPMLPQPSQQRHLPPAPSAGRGRAGPPGPLAGRGGPRGHSAGQAGRGGPPARMVGQAGRRGHGGPPAPSAGRGGPPAPSAGHAGPPPAAPGASSVPRVIFSCPCCPYESEYPHVIKRHVQGSHPEFDLRNLAHMAPPKKECPNCRVPQSLVHMARHAKVCPQRPATEPSRESPLRHPAAMPRDEFHTPPRGAGPPPAPGTPGPATPRLTPGKCGGQKVDEVLGMFKVWLKVTPLADTTQMQYARDMRNFLLYVAENDRRWVATSMIDPTVGGGMPGYNSYRLEVLATPFTEQNFFNSYLKFLEWVKRALADRKNSAPRNLYDRKLNDVREMVDMAKADNNDAKERGKKEVMVRVDPSADARAMDALHDVIDAWVVSNQRKEMYALGPRATIDDFVRLRDFIFLELIIAGGGNRSDAYRNMTTTEFFSASEDRGKDGKQEPQWIVQVRCHKTGKGGHAKVSFDLPLLSLTRQYIANCRKFSVRTGSQIVLPASRSGAVMGNVDRAADMLERFIRENDLSDERLPSHQFRHYVGTWRGRHSDRDIRETAAADMRHSKETNLRYYQHTEGESQARATRTFRAEHNVTDPVRTAAVDAALDAATHARQQAEVDRELGLIQQQHFADAAAAAQARKDERAARIESRGKRHKKRWLRQKERNYAIQYHRRRGELPNSGWVPVRFILAAGSTDEQYAKILDSVSTALMAEGFEGGWNAAAGKVYTSLEALARRERRRQELARAGKDHAPSDESDESDESSDESAQSER